MGRASAVGVEDPGEEVGEVRRADGITLAEEEGRDGAVGQQRSDEPAADGDPRRSRGQTQEVAEELDRTAAARAREGEHR
jgi:hypothetical protein